jgi:sugar transferase (PEP-CTERM/EpsH1 system associated)
MRILFLTHRLPYALNRGDRIRAIYLIREMSRVGEVSVFSLLHDEEEAAAMGRVPHAASVTGVRVPRIRNLMTGAARWFSARPMTHSLLDAPDARQALQRVVRASPPDVVVTLCSGMARFALEAPLAGRPFVLDMVDVDSVKWRMLAEHTRGPLRWVYQREARTLSAFEATAAARAVETFVVNDRERDALRAIAPAAHVRVVPIGIDIDAFAPPDGPATDPTVIFCGVMDYGPNEAGVSWFATEVWPLVRRAKPDARFLIVGARPTPAVLGLGARDTSIKVVGAVPAVQPYLWQSAVSVAPLLLARGFQNKVLEGLAAGLPVVVTQAVAEGLPSHVRNVSLVADEPQAFADAVVRLLDMSPAARRALAARASVTDLGWSAALRDVASVLRNAAGGATESDPAAAAPERARGSR